MTKLFFDVVSCLEDCDRDLYCLGFTYNPGTMECREFSSETRTVFGISPNTTIYYFRDFIFDYHCDSVPNVNVTEKYGNVDVYGFATKSSGQRLQRLDPYGKRFSAVAMAMVVIIMVLAVGVSCRGQINIH